MGKSSVSNNTPWSQIFTKEKWHKIDWIKSDQSHSYFHHQDSFSAIKKISDIFSLKFHLAVCQWKMNYTEEHRNQKCFLKKAGRIFVCIWAFFNTYISLYWLSQFQENKITIKNKYHCCIFKIQDTSTSVKMVLLNINLIAIVSIKQFFLEEKYALCMCCFWR